MPNPHVRTRLSQATLKELLHYDSNDGIFSWNVDRTYLARAGDEAGSVRKSDGNVLITIKGKVWLATRLAWLYMTGDLPSGRIICKNGDRTDLRWANLALQSDYYSMNPVAVYERRRRHKTNAMHNGMDPKDFKKSYHDPRDPKDPRNRDIYQAAPVVRTKRTLPRDERGRVIWDPK